MVPNTCVPDYSQLFNDRMNGLLPPAAEQIIVVKYLGGFKARVSAYQQQNKVWTPLLNTVFAGVIGKNGLVSVSEKQEGDLKTPAGLYPLGTAFGTHPLTLKIDYRYITANDKFIDDTSNPHYNTWINGTTDAKSYEEMMIAPYKAGIVVNYNINPIVPGKGSAIFMHVWESANHPTEGCIALEEQHLITLLHWLDKKKQPYIYFTT